MNAHPGWQRGSVYVGLRDIPGSAFEIPTSEGVNLVLRFANKVEGLDKVAQQERFQLERTREDVARADVAKGLPFAKRDELVVARERCKALDAALVERANPKVPDPEQQWDELVRAQHRTVIDRTARTTHALHERCPRSQEGHA